MLLEKNGIVVNVSDKDHISGYLNEGWKETTEKPKQEKKTAEKPKK